MIRRTTVLLIASLCAAALALGGCASLPGPTAAESTHRALHEAASQKTAPVTPPAAVSAALLPPLRAPTPDAGAAEERFDVTVQRVPARRFFMGLVKGTHYNMVVPRKLEGDVTLRLRNVTVPQVMDIVRSEYGYEYQRNGNVFMVLPETLKTRIFQVDYLDITRKGVSRTRVTSGETTNQPMNNTRYGYGGGLYGNRGGMGLGRNGNGNGNDEQERNSTAIRTEIESNFWKDLTSSLNAIVGGAEGRQVVVNADSGVIVVRALPGELHNVAMYLDQVQGIVSREVVLEAKVIEVALNNGFQSGINWGALGRPGNGETIFGSQVAGSHLFDLGRSDLAGANLNITPGNAITSLPTSAFGGTFALALNLSDFNAFIELLQTQGTTHVLSSPRVATLNNQQAVIKVGSDEFFVTGIYQNTYVTTSTASTSNVILQPFFSGIALDVTPQINDNGEVTLHIHPTVSEVTDQQKSFTVSGETTSLPLALSQVRESDSVVRAKSGQIIVIGGLMKNETHDRVYKTPLLGDIPFLGALFRHTQKQNVKTELVILLKPIVIDHPGQWSKLSQSSLDRLDSLDPPAE
ncbi:MAG TPA: pilus (MSHA type) biogenesis protein MshL [Gammaproteobacteria bacterium]|nr:pilus (MSHA type) biogenesis protein MshL [Gammaproteobacteria bacterium]